MPVQFKFFMIPAFRPDQGETDLNAFLQSTQALTIHREFVSQGENSFWSLAVEFMTGNPHAGSGINVSAKKGRVDYKSLLSPEDFAVFVQLRDWRKDAAEKEGTPVYTILNNDQLATIARQRITTLAALGGIDGIGDARLQKYGQTVINIVQAAAPGTDDKPK